jgi:2-phosphosulfolactate phosphatase
VRAQIRQLLTLDLDVAVIGAGTRGERRKEDDLACARIAAGLVAAGYATDPASDAIIDACGRLPVDWCASGSSAEFLRRVGRQDDIDFVLTHVDDVDMVFEVRGTEVLRHELSGAHAH